MLLTDSDVDAKDVVAFLVQDGVDRDRRLAGLSVSDDQLPLPAADRYQRIQCFQAGLHRLMYRPSLDDAWRLDLHLAGLIGFDRTLPVHRLSKRVYHTSERPFAHRHRSDLARSLHGVPFPV